MLISEKFERPGSFCSAKNWSHEDGSIFVISADVREINTVHGPLCYIPLEGVEAGPTLNAVSAFALADEFGDNSKEWIGQEISISTVEITFTPKDGSDEVTTQVFRCLPA